MISLTHIPFALFHTLRSSTSESLVALGTGRPGLGQSCTGAHSTPKAEKTNREACLPSRFLSAPQAIWGHHCYTPHEEAANWFSLSNKRVGIGLLKIQYEADRELG